MRNEDQVLARCDLYKKQLVLAIEEKTISPVVDPSLDMLILSLIDKLEALDWVLDPNGEDNESSFFILENNDISH